MPKMSGEHYRDMVLEGNLWASSLDEACKKYHERKSLSSYIYNALEKQSRMSSRINDGLINLYEYSDLELMSIEGIGYKTVDLIRVAWLIFNKKKSVQPIIPGLEDIRDYTNGSDIVKWICLNNLSDKKIKCINGNKIIFLNWSKSHEDGSKEWEQVELDVITGEIRTVRDRID